MEQHMLMISSIVSDLILIGTVVYLWRKVLKRPTKVGIRDYLKNHFHNDEQLEADYLPREEATAFVERVIAGQLLTDERAQEITAGVEQRLNDALDTRVATAIGPASVPARRLQRAEDAAQKLIDELRSLLGDISGALQLPLEAEIHRILDAPDPERNRLAGLKRQADLDLRVASTQLTEAKSAAALPEVCTDAMAEAEARRQLALIPGAEAEVKRASQAATEAGDALSSYERDRLRPPEEDRLRKLRKKIEELRDIGGNLGAVENILQRSLQSSPPPPPPRTRLGVGGPPPLPSPADPPAGDSVPPLDVGDDELQESESNPPPPPAGEPEAPSCCQKCGNRTPPGSRFCPSCGGRLA